MFAKTVCKPGSFMSVVPVGLLITLQYNKDGCIEKALLGYDDNNPIAVTQQQFEAIHTVVPDTIQVKGGTTWIKGVLYTSTKFGVSGILPDCLQDSYLTDIVKTQGEGYTFYAGNIYSLATGFSAVMTIRNWLLMAGFELLPGWIVPAGMTEESFEKLIHTDRYPFEYPLMSGLMIYEGTEFSYYPLKLKQYITKSVSQTLDESGYIQAAIKTATDPVTIQYSEAVYFNIQTNSAMVFEESGKLVYSYPTDNKKRDRRPAKVTCSVCGKTFNISGRSPITCEDAHCRSMLYPDIQHFLNIMDMPSMDYSRFEMLINSDAILCLTDLFLLPEYSDCKLEVTLSKLLQAAVPVGICADTSVFTLLANRCSNSIKTLQYYIQNPSMIDTDLNMASLFSLRLSNWFSDGYNATTINTLLELSNINIVGTGKKFDGAPIFRNTTILITGRFQHGDLDEITSILESYDANVVTEFSNNVAYVVVGDFKENIDGKAIQLARAANVPVVDESKFFDSFDIDEDLRQNLL